MRLRDRGLADEFDRCLAIYYREWEDERELNRLKVAIGWGFGGEEKGKSKGTSCSHERFEKQASGELKCKDCGATGN
jgi:hypothetical protein